ncbi:MAG: hypothetical protein ACJAVV_001197 [Alphaproteobacteria bacterium]|jgi:hypothetical protein
MKFLKAVPFAVLSALALTGCSSDDDPIITDTPPIVPPEFANVRVIHASPDAPIVDIFAGSTAITSMQDVDYQVASGLLELNPGDFTFRVEAETPAGNAEVLVIPATLSNDTVYNVLAVGDVANLEALLVTSIKGPIADGNIRVQVVHGAPDAPMVDVYVTAPDTVLADEQPLATLSFKEFTGSVEVPGGDYQIRIAAAGTTTVVFDSGTLALAAGADLLITATENVATGDSPVALLVADGTASSVILDTNTLADVRAIHGIANAPAVDVLAVVPDADDIVLFDGAPFKGVTGYIAVAGGDYVLDVVADADNTVVAINDAMISLTNGMRYTALANNTLASADLDLIEDNRRPLATAAQVRIFHASQATGAVDIYVTADGVITDATPNFVGVEYMTEALAETGYVQLVPGSYFVTVTGTGSKDAAIATGELVLSAAGIYTAIAVDGDNSDMGPQLILADDFVAPAAE